MKPPPGQSVSTAGGCSRSSTGAGRRARRPTARTTWWSACCAGVLAVEHTLLEGGRGSSVIRQRMEFEELMRERFEGVIERATGRRVIGFMSGNRRTRQGRGWSPATTSRTTSTARASPGTPSPPRARRTHRPTRRSARRRLLAPLTRARSTDARSAPGRGSRPSPPGTLRRHRLDLAAHRGGQASRSRPRPDADAA
jgi:hypothetical protein